MMRFASIATKNSISDNGLSVQVHTTLTSACSICGSAITLMTDFSWCSVFLSAFTWCTVRIGTGGELGRSISLSVGRILYMNLSMTDVPEKTGTARFPTIPDMTRMQADLTRTCNRTVPMTLILWLVVPFSQELSQMWTDGVQSVPKRTSAGRLSPAARRKHR